MTDQPTPAPLPSDADGLFQERIWTVKVGGRVPLLPSESDPPMRAAVARAFEDVTGVVPEFTFSGWGGTLTEPERAVVENRAPSEEHYQQWLREHPEAAVEPVAPLPDACTACGKEMDARCDCTPYWRYLHYSNTCEHGHDFAHPEVAAPLPSTSSEIPDRPVTPAEVREYAELVRRAGVPEGKRLSLLRAVYQLGVDDTRAAAMAEAQEQIEAWKEAHDSLAVVKVIPTAENHDRYRVAYERARALLAPVEEKPNG
jgi:hypothetical protein